MCFSVLNIIDSIPQKVLSDGQLPLLSISAWATFTLQIVGCVVASCWGAVYFPSQTTATAHRPRTLATGRRENDLIHQQAEVGLNLTGFGLLNLISHVLMYQNGIGEVPLPSQRQSRQFRASRLFRTVRQHPRCLGIFPVKHHRLSFMARVLHSRSVQSVGLQ